MLRLDERHRRADRIDAQLVGYRRDLEEVRTARTEQGDDLVHAHLGTAEDTVEHLADGGARPRRPSRYRRRGRDEVRGSGVAPGGPAVVAGEPFEVGSAADREAHVLVQPAVTIAHVLGVD